MILVRRTSIKTIPWNEVTCTDFYTNLQSDKLSFKTFVLTVVIILLSITIEHTVHSIIYFDLVGLKIQYLESKAKALPLQRDSNCANEVTSAEQAIAGRKKVSAWCTPNPSPDVRANRLTIATLLFMPLCIAFWLRAADFMPINIPSACLWFVDWPPEPNWYAVTIFNIIPFIIGSTAWLRSFVDCLLARWGKSLGYIGDKKDLKWPPYAPFFLAIYMVVLPIFGITCLVKYGAVAIMGGRGKEGRDKEDVEPGEERMGLVAGIE